MTASALPFPRLREPITIGNFEVPNRVMMTVHGPRLTNRRYMRYLEERLRGGVGFVGLAAATGLYDMPVGPGRFMPEYAGSHDTVPAHPLTAEGIAHYDRFIDVLREQAELIHRYGARCAGQVYHSGGSRHIDGGSDAYQPACAPSHVMDEFRRNAPHALTLDEIADVVQAFGHAGRRVAEAGVDAIEIHGAHGYLVNEFLSPYNNRRTDRYGGSFDNRMRFVLEVIAAMRELVGDHPIGIRLNGSDGVVGGLTNGDMQAVAARLESAGVAYVSISGGTYGGIREGFNRPYVPPVYFGTAVNVADAAGIRAAVGVPVIVASRIIDMEMAEDVLASGAADMVGLTRPLIADAAIVRKSFAGEADRVVPCIGCNECHAARTVSCPVNPAVGREEEMELHPAAVPKRVLVVGGGPAGMACAQVAAARGHDVVLCERRDRLGGVIADLACDPARPELSRWLDLMKRSLDESGVELRLGIEVTSEAVAEIAPDVVVLASGARDECAVSGPSVHTALSVLSDDDSELRLGARVLVDGGLDDHMPALATADLLAGRGHQVTLLTQLFHPGERLEAATRHALARRLYERGATIEPATALVSVEDDEVVVRNTLTNATERRSGFDSVVVVAERRPLDELRASVVDLGYEVHLAGDCLAPRRFVHASLDGARVGLAL